MRKLLLVTLLLVCGNLLHAQNKQAAPNLEARKSFKIQQQENVRAGVISRMKLSPSTESQIEVIMSDFLAAVEKQKANPSTLSKNIMTKTMADRDKRLKAVLGAEGMKKFIAYEKQMLTSKPAPPPGANPKFAGN